MESRTRRMTSGSTYMNKRISGMENVYEQISVTEKTITNIFPERKTEIKQTSGMENRK